MRHEGSTIVWRGFDWKMKMLDDNGDGEIDQGEFDGEI
jgi:hypothetical protein